MNKTDLRKSLHKYIDELDEQKLEEASDILYSLAKEEVVGYRTNGKAVTVEGLKKTAEKADQDLKEGNLTSLDDLIEESKNW